MNAKFPKCHTPHLCEQVCIDWLVVGQCWKFFKDFIDRLFYEVDSYPLVRSETHGPAKKNTSKQVVIEVRRKGQELVLHTR